MDNYNILEKAQRESDMALLNQYRKELADLEAGTGLAKPMSRSEINYAKRALRECIEGYRGYLY